MLYDMTWRDFFLYREVFEEQEWERLHLWRLDYTQRHNLAISKKSDAIKPTDVIKLPLDAKFLKVKEVKRITLTEIKEMLKAKGEYKGKIGI